MTDNIDYTRFAGRVVFPRNSAELVSTNQCPACFTPLRSTVCAECGLDLGHPAAHELHEASLSAASALERRVTIIGRLRHAVQSTAQAASTAQAVPVAQPAAEAETVAATASAGPSAISRATATAPVGASPAARQRKYSSIQVTLLVVGILLLSVAAIFFLIYAFINFGIIWRSVIIAAITLAAVGSASILRRRGHTATAEGIAVFAIVLIYLDTYALRANDFFGLLSSDGQLYWGFTIILTSVLFLAWSRLSGLRAPSVVGFTMIAPGVGVLVAGAAKGSDAGTRAYLVAASIATAGLIHRFALPPVAASLRSGPSTEPPTPTRGTRSIERMISLCTTLLALAAAFVLAFTVAPESDWSGSIAVVAIVVISAAHLWALAAPRAAQPWRACAYIFAGMGGVFAASALGFAALRSSSDVFAIMAPGIAAATLALVLEVLAVRGPGGWRKFSAVAAWSSAVVLAITLVAPLFIAIAATVGRVVYGFENTWAMHPTDTLQVALDHDGWAVLTLAIIGVVAGAFWTAAGIIRRRGPALAWFGAGVALTAAALVGTLWTIMAGWLLLSAVAVIALSSRKLHSSSGRDYAAPTAALAIGAAAFGYVVSWASTSTWWIGSLVIIALLLMSRRSVLTAVSKAALLGIATVVALIASNSAAHYITFSASLPLDIDWNNGLRFVSILALAVFTVFAVPLGRAVHRADRRGTFWLTGTVAVITVGTLAVSLEQMSSAARSELLLPEYATSFFCSLLLLIGLILWMVLAPAHNLRVEANAAAIVAAPAFFLAISALTKFVAMPEFAATIAPILSALLAAAASLAIHLVRPNGAARWALDAGVVLVALPSVIAAVMTNSGLAWLILTLAAVTTLLLAIDSGGLFSSTSWRRHLGWLSLALATAGLWWRLRGIGVANLEPYVLPLTAALLIIAVLISRAHSKNTSDARTTRNLAAPTIVLGALLVSMLPLAINGASGTELRALIMGLSAVALLLVGSFVIVGRSAQGWWDAAAVAGAAGLLVLMIGRAVYLPVSDAARDAWILGAFVAFIAAAFGQAIPRHESTDHLRATASQILGIVAMAAVLALEAPAFEEFALGQLRILSLVLLYSAVHVIGFVLHRSPLSRTVAWFAIALAGLTALTGGAMGTLDYPELVTVPLALALLATGTIHMAEVPAARSWQWLAPGIAMLLVPSLWATFSEQPLWRLVGLGVVGVGVIIVGVARRLQAPFTIGVVVVIVHGIATFLPQLRAAYEFVPWWLWAAAAGIILTALAFRYEQRSRDIRNAVVKYAALR